MRDHGIAIALCVLGGCVPTPPEGDPSRRPEPVGAAAARDSVPAVELPVSGLRAPTTGDYGYALALAAKLGYYDLAEAELDGMRASGDPALEWKGELGLAKIRVFQARAEIDRNKELAGLDAAIARMEALIDGGAAGTEGFIDLGELYIEKAKFLVERAEEEPDQAAAFKESARGTYDKAIASFKWAAFDDSRTVYRRSTYYTIESEFGKAVTWPLADERRKAILVGLKDRVEHFCWDHEDYIEAYYGYTILGQVLANLCDKPAPKEADLEEAFAAFGSALAIPVTKGTKLCRTLAYSKYLGECNRFGFYDRTIALAQAMRKEYPAIEELEFGQAAVIEEAHAYFGKREIGTYFSLLGRIAQVRSPWGSRVKRLLSKWSCDFPSVGPHFPEDWFLTGEGLTREGKFWPAIRSYQAAIAALETTPSPDLDAKFLVKSWEGAALAFLRLGLTYESYHALMAASHAARRLGDASKAAETAYNAFKTIKWRWYETKAADAAKLADQTRVYLLASFPTSRYEQGLQLHVARDLEHDGNYADAVAGYERIDKASPFYEEARSRIEICRRHLRGK